MLGPRSAVAGGTVHPGLLSGCLHAQQQPERALRLVHRGIGLGAAFLRRVHEVASDCRARRRHTFHCWEAATQSAARSASAGLAAYTVAMAAWSRRGQVFGAAGERRRQREAPHMDELVRELVGDAPVV